MKNFGVNLKEARKKLKMNQQALGDAVGVGQTTIANYEKGLRFPTGDLLKKMAEILNTSIDTLMGHRVLGHEVIDAGFDMKAYQERFLNHLLAGEEQAAIVMVWDLNPDESNLVVIYEELLMQTMVRIGNLWEEGKVTVATEHYTSHVIHKIIAMLSTIPAMRPKNGKNALCMSLSSEPHTIGIKMVSEYMNFVGVQSHYIGTNVPTESLIDMLIKKNIDLLAVSVTQSNHLDQLSNLVKALRGHDQLVNLKILIGGQGIVNQMGLLKTMAVNGHAEDFKTLKAWLVSANML